MHRLYLLGRVDFLDHQGNELRTVVAQPRRLALVAYLAASAANGVCRRDKLLGLFWPELSQDRARKALNKSVHFLRQALGEDAIISRSTEEAGIDRSRVWCDAVAFNEAFDTGHTSEALELYRGELLPSFYIEDAAGFDAWVESERSRLRRLAARAAHTLAQRRESDGQLTTAVSLARRAVDLADEDERAVRQLLELLDRLGDRAGALYAYDKFARRLSTEFGAEPAAETKALIERVRARSEPGNGGVVRVEAPPVATPQYTPHSEQSIAAAFRARGYTIERELGRGGMATVYLAHDVKHDRQVALKVLAPEVGALRLADRFAAEIRVTARLQHPNILPLFDSGAVDGMLYYAMPYVEGESLRARLQRDKQLPVDEAVTLTVALADALQHAHKVGVVHRDIKPENILLQDGRPLLADFGIALALSSAGVERITSTGLSLGTPQYMSPEQAAGELTVGPASDIYSLAAVAYELLAGEPPFTGPSTRAVLARVMLDTPRPIRTIRSTVPEAVETAILRALAKHPIDRFAAASDFGTALQAPGDTRPFGWRRFLTRHARAAAIALSTIAIVGAALVLRPTADRHTDGATSTSRVAVFPFTVQASPELAYLGDGAMDLLSEALDGAGELRRVDPFALTGYLRRTGEGPVDSERARRVALHFGAGRYVVGSIAEVGNDLRVAAALYEFGRGDAPMSEASASGHPDRVAELINDVAWQLLAGVPLGPSVRLGEIATIRAANYTALKAYLEGEALLRRGLFDSAAAKLYRAVTADSTFAIAWYRLSQASGFGGGPRLVVGVPGAVESINRAYRHRDRLSPRDSLIVATRWAWHHGEGDRAEELAQAATGLYPYLAEAWHQLAEVRTRYGWRRGRPPSEAREPLDRALALDPDYALAVLHARWLGLFERRYTDARALSGERPMRTNGFIDAQRRVVAFVLGNPATRDSVAGGLQRADDAGFYWTAWQLTTYTDSVDAARQLWRQFAAATDRSSDLRTSAGTVLGLLELSRGRWASARVEFDRAAVLIPTHSFVLPIRFAALPAFGRFETELRAMRDALRGWKIPPYQEQRWFDLPESLHPWLREYLLGMLAARLGDSSEALRHAKTLEAARRPPDPLHVRHDLALEIRALMTAEAGRADEALALLEQVRFSTASALDADRSLRPFGRFLRAELLQQLGRHDEALGWYGTFGFFPGIEFVLVAVAQLRQGEIHERLGNLDKAVYHYGRFVARWRDADPEYQPLVRDVQARIARIERERP